jgi:uncharacterized membrane protein YagU involved in acid resistance
VKIAQELASGFVAGVAATVPMTATFAWAQRIGAIGQLPPNKAVTAIRPDLDDRSQTRWASIAHLLVGGSAGAAYAVLTRAMPRGMATGALFGVGVWLVGYELVVPALTDMPRAHKDDRRRAATILFAHLVYGSALGRASRMARPRA